MSLQPENSQTNAVGIVVIWREAAKGQTPKPILYPSETAEGI